MMHPPPTPPAPWVSVAQVALIAISVLLTAVAGVLAFASLRSKQTSTADGLYKDENGEANDETQRRYQTLVKWLHGLCIVLSISGLGTAIAFGVVDLSSSEQRHRSSFSELSAVLSPLLVWVLICIQTTVAVVTKHPVTRYQIGIIKSLTCVALCGSFVIDFAPIPGAPQQQSSGLSQAGRVLAGLNGLLALLAVIPNLSYPRTPDLFRNGRSVDGVRSVSAFSRATFAWIGPYLLHAWKSDQIDVKDFNALDAATRASDLFRSIQKTSATLTGSLMKQLVVNHAYYLTWHYSITVVDGLTLVLPQTAMYRLLLALERRDNGEDDRYSLWWWAIALGAVILVREGINNAMWFYGYCRINIPWRIQLSAMVFEKAMRKKQVHGASKNKKELQQEDTSASEATLLGNDAAEEHDTRQGEEDEDANLQKMRQGVVNLIGVDANRIGNFGVFNNAFLGAVVRLAVSLTFLGKLLGWQALLAGIAVQVLFLPMNIYFSKRYSDSQDILMKVRDKKLAAVNEALNGVRQIKFSALEDRWQRKIGAVREEEIRAQWRVFESDTILLMCWILGPVLLSAASITVYAVIHGNLPPSVAFTTIAILTEIEGTLAYIPELTTNLLDALISLRRIQEYLDTPDKKKTTQPGDVIQFNNATIAWPTDADEVDEDAFKINNVNIAFPTGELSVIAGRTGSGKSLLLAAILGEAEIISGTLTVPDAPPLEQRFDSKATKGNWILPSAIAFVGQQPWIENRTLRDNILFDLPHDEERFRKVLYACSLEQDIKLLSDGELTEIGANGINLSGGQRWRVTLARALYSRAGILVMDDIFSAVDAHVGRHIFENALTGELARGRTRILVTHHVALCLPATDYQVQLGDGKVEHAGSIEALRRQDILTKIIEEENEEIAIEEDGGADGELLLDTIEIARTISVDDPIHTGNLTGVDRAETLVRKRTRSSLRRLSHTSRTSDAIEAPETPQELRKFVEEERREEGRVKSSVYFAYFRASGGLGYWVLVLVAFAGYQGLLLARSWMLRLWTENNHEAAVFAASRSPFTVQSSSSFLVSIRTTRPEIDDRTKFFLIIYTGLAVVLCIEGTLRYLLVFFGAIKASRRLFDQMTFAVLRAPLRWLDTVPVGRILNRFTADFSVVDSQLAYHCSFLMNNALVVLGIVIAAVIVSPLVLLTSSALFIICAYFAIYFLAGAREAKRLESTAKSPIFEFFSSALQGVTTVRAFGKAQSYVDQMFDKLDTHGETMWYQWLCNRWLGWRLSVVGACFAAITAALVVSLPGVDAALGGFALAFALSYTDAIVFTLRNYSMVELGMNATERIVEYTKIPTEDQGGADAPAIWPSEGRVEVNDLVVGYAPDLPPVLKGLTFSVERNERIGVVGRTGAGKSSLTLALFRFLEPREGSIVIDGVDISKIKLQDLRSRLSIIAQDPVLFSGTIRSNLDPFNQYQDHELREALERCHLVASSSSAASTIAAEPTRNDDGTKSLTNINPFASLASVVTEGGLNLSQGQRQLLCLARAVIARPKVMVLDEATSAVDKATDELIQRSIREEFKNSTLIVIAHRLSTIADFDRILVMRDGTAAEFGTPKELLETAGEGVFRAMVDDSGERDALRDIILGRG